MGARSDGGRSATCRPPGLRREGRKGDGKMIDSRWHRLAGLEHDNLLAFLALLGLLRAIEAVDQEISEKEKWRPRVAWDIDVPPMRPKLFLARAVEPEEVADRANGGIDLLSSAHDFGGRKDLNYPPNECRALLTAEANAARADARNRIDLLAGLMSDAAIKGEKEETIDPTPLCLLF